MEPKNEKQTKQITKFHSNKMFSKKSIVPMHLGTSNKVSADNIKEKENKLMFFNGIPNIFVVHNSL